MAPNGFNGHVALVTGGGSGIGRAVCLLLARDGARVVVTDLTLEAARETLKTMPNPVKHLALQMDVTQQSAIENVIMTSRDKFGEVPSLLVNCAGIFDMTPIQDISQSCFDKIINTNLKGTFLVTQTVVKALLELNHEGEEGRCAIVNVSGIAGKTGFPQLCHYAASKGGIIAFTKSCAAEMAKRGIRVNCVLPGLITTPMTSAIDTKMKDAYIDLNAVGRSGTPEEVAEVVVFLLSRRSSYMVGACVEVTGGSGM